MSIDGESRTAGVTVFQVSAESTKRIANDEFDDHVLVRASVWQV